MDFSKSEKELIGAISPHWANIIEKNEVDPLNLYIILAQEAFIENKQGSEFEALRRVCKACQNCSPYRLTTEFDELCKFPKSTLQS